MLRRRRGREDRIDAIRRRRNWIEPSSNFNVRDEADEDLTSPMAVVVVVV
jgi:hypothetical protein